MLEKSRNAVFFQWFVCQVKAAGAESRGQRRNQKLYAAVAKSRFRSKTSQFRSTFWSSDVEKFYAAVAKSRFRSKTRQFRSTFWSSDVEKLYAAVSESRFWSQNVQSTSPSERFLKFWKLHMYKSKRTKHVSSEALSVLAMSNAW